MREFSLEFTPKMLQGLRRSPRGSLNSAGLSRALNAQFTPYGMEPYESVEALAVAKESWPLPQVFFTKGYQVSGPAYLRGLAVSHTTVSNIADDFSISSLLSLPASSDSIWHFVDYHSYWLLVNDDYVVKIDPTTGVASVHVATATFPTFKTATDFNGQLVVGNITSPFHGCDEQFVAWSKIGRVDFDQTTKIDNTSGFYKVPWSGPVLVVKALGDRVMVYGDRGIMVMIPKGRFWQSKHLTNYGIAGRGAVGGDLNSHVFVDAKGYLGMATGEGIQRLGFKEFFKDSLEDNILITQDGFDNRFFIGSNDSSYLLSNGNLSEIYQQVTGVQHINGENKGFARTIGSMYMRMTTNPVDFQTADFKTVMAIQVSGRNLNEVDVAVEWKQNPSDNWRVTDWVPTNDQGYAYCPTTAQVFRFAVRSRNLDAVEIESIRVKYKTTGKRFERGKTDVGQIST